MLSSIRTHGASVSLVTLVCFVATLLPALPARADTSGSGSGGAPTLATPLPAGNTPSAAANVELATGAAVSAFSFELPTARGDAQAALGLTYSSSIGVSQAGVGWSLSLPSIVRKRGRWTPAL
jgi:hypothetical protein